MIVTNKTKKQNYFDFFIKEYGPQQGIVFKNGNFDLFQKYGISCYEDSFHDVRIIPKTSEEETEYVYRCEMVNKGGKIYEIKPLNSFVTVC